MTCKTCGAALTDRDRFCVACGMPNADSRLHPRFQPRFGPVAEPAPLYPEARSAQPGEVSCVRCERPTPRADAYCAWCGMEMDLAVLAADRADTDGVWTTWGPEGTEPYRPLGPLTTPLRVLLLLVSILVAVALALLAGRFVTLEEGTLLGFDGPSMANWSDRAMVLLAGVGAVTATVMLLWCRRAARNLVALCARDARFPAWLAWACWFIPVANLVLPMFVVEDLWRCSGADGPPLTRSRRRERLPFALHLWWPCVALGMLLVVVAGAATPTGTGVELDTWRVVLVLGAIGALVLGVGALALAVVVDDLNSRQVRRAEALGPPGWMRRRQGTEPAETEELVPTSPIRRGDDGPTWGRY